MVTTLQHHSERYHWNQRRSNRNDSVTLVSISCYLQSFSCENSRFQFLRVCFPSTLQFFSFITHTDHIFTFQESNENSAQQLVDVKGKNLKVYKTVHGDDHIKSDDEIDAIEIGGHGVSFFLNDDMTIVVLDDSYAYNTILYIICSNGLIGYSVFKGYYNMACYKCW